MCFFLGSLSKIFTTCQFFYLKSLISLQLFFREISLKLPLLNTTENFVISIIIMAAFSFTKLLWPGDSEGTFRSSSQAATCLLHMVEASRSHCPFQC